jgi:hypothetical protein
MRWIGILLLMSGFCDSFAQKTFETREQAWVGYFNQTRLSKRSGLWVDAHLRLNDHFVQEKSLALIRLGYLYYASDHTRLAFGYAYARHYPHVSTAPDFPEHRPWQQVQWMDKRSWFNLMQWVRLEERFRQKADGAELISDYAFNFRARYNIALTIPVTRKEVQPKTPFIFVSNEVFVNFGKEITYNYFDQNRLFAGIGYQFTPHLNAHAGYMYVFQQLPAGNQYVEIHAIRFFVFHNLDFRSTP